MTDQYLLYFLGLVFVTVFLLSQALISPTFGTNRADSRKLKNRLDRVLSGEGDFENSIVKENQLSQLSPLTRRIESHPAMQEIQLYLEQAGKEIYAYRFLLLVVSIGIISIVAAWFFFHNKIITLIVAFLVIFIPIFWLRLKRKKYIDKFEEQLPEALDMMSRSLRTGYPFNESMKIVATEMDNPISKEFGLTFEEINYGRNVDVAFAFMIKRVPSISLIAMSTAILIQKETGGNLAEVLKKISSVLRGRFKFQRHIKTMAAEGIFSGWVLCLLPLGLFLVLNLLNADHFTALYEHPDGIMLFYAIGVLEIIAIFWIRKIVNIDV